MGKSYDDSRLHLRLASRSKVLTQPFVKSLSINFVGRRALKKFDYPKPVGTSVG